MKSSTNLVSLASTQTGVVGLRLPFFMVFVFIGYFLW